MSTRLNKNKPSLPSFGLLLLQIYLGKEIWFGLNASDGHPKSKDMMNMTEARAKCEDMCGVHFFSAVKACLGSGTDSRLGIAGPFHRDERARMGFISKVIKPIQFALEEMFGFELSRYKLAGFPDRQIVVSEGRENNQITISENSILSPRDWPMPKFEAAIEQEHIERFDRATFAERPITEE
jgi:hypothetical protein